MAELPRSWCLGRCRESNGTTAAMAAGNTVDYESSWFVPNESIASTYTYLALARFAQGDLSGAEEQLAATQLKRRLAPPSDA